MPHLVPSSACHGLYTIYKNQEGSAYSRDVFMNVIRGNVGKLIAGGFRKLYRSLKNRSLPLMMY